VAAIGVGADALVQRGAAALGPMVARIGCPASATDLGACRWRDLWGLGGWRGLSGGQGLSDCSRRCGD
jgi:hypothetical protein